MHPQPEIKAVFSHPIQRSFCYTTPMPSLSPDK